MNSLIIVMLGWFFYLEGFVESG